METIRHGVKELAQRRATSTSELWSEGTMGMGWDGHPPRIWKRVENNKTSDSNVVNDMDMTFAIFFHLLIYDEIAGSY